MPKISDPGMLATLNAAAGSHPAINPKIPLELTHSAGANALQQAELARQGALNSKANSEAVKAAADARIAGALAAAQLAKAQADAAASDGSGALDPATKTFYAQQVLAGAPMPAIGMGKQAAAARQEIMAEVAKLAGASGLSGADQARQIAHYKAGSGAIANLEKMASTIGVNEQTAMANGQQYIDRSAELPGQTPFSPINALSNFFQRHLGGTTISAADAAYNTFTNEYAKVVAGSPTGAGTLSDSARHEAMSTISGNGSLEQKQKAFEQMKADMENRMAAIHGGVDNAYKALTEKPGYVVPASTQGLAVLPGNFGGSGGGSAGGGGAAGGGSSGGGGPLPGATPATGATKAETMDPNTASLIGAMIKNGYTADQMNKILVPMGKVGPGGITQEVVDKARQTLKAGGALVPQYEVPTSLKDRVISSPLGVGVGSAADAGLAGFSDELGAGVGALTGQGNYSDLLSSLNAKKEAAFAADPRAHLLGTIAGTATGAAGLEGGLGNIASRLGEYGLERGLGTAGARAAFNGGRALSSPIAADAIFGGLYGAGEDNDNRVGGATMGAALGAGGGMFGRGLAKAVSGAVGGVKNAAVQYLNDAGIPLTFGQAVGQSGRLGNAARSIENGMSSIPVIGDIINGRQREGMQAFNEAAFKQGLSPIDATVGQAGAEGVAAARKAVSGAYSDTLDPLAFQVDPQFGADYTNTALRAGELPRTMARNANDTLRLRVQDNIGPDGMIAGNDFQQSLRGLRQDAGSLRNEPYGADFGQVTQQAQDAMRGLVDRQAPGALPAFDAANLANRNVSVLKDAVNRARNGTRSGQTDMFTPSQLSDAAAANAKRFGGTEGTPDQPFFDLTRAGQQVLPSTIPDSGTGFRLATAAIPGLAGGAGAGLGWAGGDAKTGAKTGLVLGGLAALGGSKTAQRALVSTLLDRPDWAEPVAQQILRSAPRAGMMFAGLGNALNPALVPAR